MHKNSSKELHSLHRSLCIMNKDPLKEDWLNTLSFAGYHSRKLVFAFIALALGYINACQSDYFLSQIPFYLSSFILCAQIGSKLNKHLPKLFQPFDLLITSIYSVILIMYLLNQGSEAFNISDGQLQKLTESGIQLMMPDFQFTGYVFAFTFLLFFFASYLFIQHQRAGPRYTEDSFNYEKFCEILKIIHDEASVADTKLWNSIWLGSYGLLALVLLFVGFRIRMYFVIVLTLFGMGLSLGNIPDKMEILDSMFLYSMGFIALNATFFLGKMKDTFSAEVKS